MLAVPILERVSKKSKSTVELECVSENSTGGKSGAIRSSGNIFETSRRDKPQYFVDVVKDKRTSACLCPISTQKHQGGNGGYMVHKFE